MRRALRAFVIVALLVCSRPTLSVFVPGVRQSVAHNTGREVPVLLRQDDATGAADDVEGGNAAADESVGAVADDAAADDVAADDAAADDAAADDAAVDDAAADDAAADDAVADDAVADEAAAVPADDGEENEGEPEGQTVGDDAVAVPVDEALTPDNAPVDPAAGEDSTADGAGEVEPAAGATITTTIVPNAVDDDDVTAANVPVDGEEPVVNGPDVEQDTEPETAGTGGEAADNTDTASSSTNEADGSSVSVPIPLIAGVGGGTVVALILLGCCFAKFCGGKKKWRESNVESAPGVKASGNYNGKGVEGDLPFDSGVSIPFDGPPPFIGADHDRGARSSLYASGSSSSTGAGRPDVYESGASGPRGITDSGAADQYRPGGGSTFVTGANGTVPGGSVSSEYQRQPQAYDNGWKQGGWQRGSDIGGYDHGASAYRGSAYPGDGVSVYSNSDSADNRRYGEQRPYGASPSVYSSDGPARPMYGGSNAGSYEPGTDRGQFAGGAARVGSTVSSGSVVPAPISSPSIDAPLLLSMSANGYGDSAILPEPLRDIRHRPLMESVTKNTETGVDPLYR